MLRDLRNYILETDFQINYIKEKVNIVNYQSIDHFDENTIMIRYNGGVVKIKGQDLTIAKLLKDEVLISGKIKGIELN